MTERTLLKQTRQEEYDDDSISVTSSLSEAYSADHEFSVDKILAEKKGDDGKTSFLVSWDDYPVEMSTWEPKKNIRHGGILDDWKLRKEQEAKGLAQPFDVLGFEARKERLAQEKAERHRRRKIKRKQLGIPVSPEPGICRHAGESDSTEAEESYDTPEDYPGIQKKAKKSQKIKRSNKVFGQGLNKSDKGGTSEESLAEELKSKTDKKRSKEALQAIPEKRAVEQSSKEFGHRRKPSSMRNSQKPKIASSPSSSSSDVPLIKIAEKRRQAQQQSESTDTTISRQPMSTAKRPLKSRITGTSISNTSSSARSHTARAPSLSSSRGAIRGGSSLGLKNIFSSRGPAKKRRNIIENSADPLKDPKHYANMHTLRKAELAGRGVADSAPDVSALGGLYRPSDPSTFLSLKTARDAAPSTESKQQESYLEWSQMDIDELAVEHNSPKEPAALEAWVPGPDLGPPLSLGYNPEPSRPEYSMSQHRFGAICHFWYLRGSCERGYQCSFEHTDDARLPFGPSPPGHRCNCRPESITSPANPPAQYVQSSKLRSPPHRHSSQGRHDNESPYGGFRHDLSAGANTKNLAAPPSQHDGRPVFTFQNEAICPFYFELNNCSKGGKCKYLHTRDIKYAIAPRPGRKNETCKHWADGHCSKSSHQCVYLHGYPDATLGSPESKQQQTEPSIPSPIIRDSAIALAGPRKSVSFAVEEPMVLFDEPETISNSHPTPSRGHSINHPLQSSKYDRVCVFWKRGYCWRGDDCAYWHSIDGSDKENNRKAPIPSLEDVTKEGAASHMAQKASEENSIAISAVDCHYVAESVNDSDPNRSNSFNDCCPSRLIDLHSTDGVHLRLQTKGKFVKSQTQAVNLGQEVLTSRQAKLDQIGLIPNQQQTGLEMPNLSKEKIVREVLQPKSQQPKTKIRMDSYCQKKAIDDSGDGTKAVIFGKDETKSVVLDFGDLTSARQYPWGKSLADIDKLHFTKFCLAQDLKAQVDSFQYQTLWQASLGSSATDEQATQIMSKAWEHMRLNCAGFVSVCSEFIVLIYPAIEEWKFLEIYASFSPEMRLRYVVFQTSSVLQTPSDTCITANPCHYQKNMVESIHGLNFQTFVPKIRSKQRYHFFLLFPSTANLTASLITKFLQESCSQCTFYSSQTGGAWSFFVNDASVDVGIVLIHESAIASVCDLPYLHRLMAPVSAKSKSISFWYISEGTAEYPIYGPPDGSTLGQITATRLLPHGHAFFLTPSFLVAEPERAKHLLDWFIGRLSDPRTSPGTWKLVCAYDIGEYLLDLAIDKSAERDQVEAQYQGDARKDAIMEEKGLSYATCLLRFELHDTVVQMLAKTTKNLSLDDNSDALDEFESPIIHADRFVDADSEEALVTWFAGWAICKLDQFRKFTVVGTAPNSEKRAGRIRAVTSGVESPRLGQTGRARGKSARSSERAPHNSSKEILRSRSPRFAERSFPTFLESNRRFRDHPALQISPASPPEDSDINMSVESATMSGRPSALMDNEKSRTPPHKYSDTHISSEDNHGSGRDGAGSKQSIDATVPVDSPCVFSPPQFDAAGDERSGSSASNSSSHSFRLSNTIRPQLAGKPGCIPREYRDPYRAPHRQLHLVEASNDKGRDISLVKSPVGVTRQEEVPKVEEIAPTSVEAMDESEPTTKQIEYEATTTWYGRWCQEGKGWEHIYVESWEKVRKHLGIK